jgi:hypothetical protein
MAVQSSIFCDKKTSLVEADILEECGTSKHQRVSQANKNEADRKQQWQYENVGLCNNRREVPIGCLRTRVN